MNFLSPTQQLLQKWINSAPERAAEVVEILAGSGIDMATIERELAVKAAKPEKAQSSIPTFDPEVTQPVSPMLQERLMYAGSISDSTEKWLGTKDMQKFMASKRILRVFDVLKLNWEGSAPARLKRGQLGLFGFSPNQEEDITFLAWEGKGHQEPKLIRYSGQNEHVFENLDAFLAWATR